ERACDRDTLLLPARELTRILARLLGNSHPLEILHRRGLRLIARLTAHPDGTKRAVLQDREMWEKIEVLKDHPDFTAHQLNVPDVVGELDAIDDYSSALMLLQAVYAADQGRLARAGRSADDDPLAAIDTEVDLLQHVKLPIPFMDADHLDDRVVPRARIGAGVDSGFGHVQVRPSCASGRYRTVVPDTGCTWT